MTTTLPLEDYKYLKRHTIDEAIESRSSDVELGTLIARYEDVAEGNVKITNALSMYWNEKTFMSDVIAYIKTRSTTNIFGMPTFEVEVSRSSYDYYGDIDYDDVTVQLTAYKNKLFYNSQYEIKAEKLFRLLKNRAYKFEDLKADKKELMPMLLADVIDQLEE